MKYATLSLPSAGGRDAAPKFDAAGAHWARFGDAMFVYAAANKWRRLSDELGNIDAEGDVRKSDLHLVTQKGRTFQLDYPDVPILLDKGRYLLAAIDRDAVKAISGHAEPCYRIEPLQENVTVFETHAPRGRASPPSGVRGLAEALDRNTLETALSTLVSFPTRHSTSTHFHEAAIWARDRLIEAGATSDLVQIDVAGIPSWNVVARKEGNAADRGAVLIVAHLDSVNTQGGPDAPAPGADDNASGSAGLLTLAEAMCRRSYDHDLVFVLFGGEEQGLHGSTQFVASLGEAHRSRIRAVLNMDMIGSVNTEPRSVLLEGAALSQAMIDGLAAAAAEVTSLAVQTSLNPFASDHVPFIEAGIPAVLTIEGADGANAAIHTEGDILSLVDPAFTMEILRMNAAYLATVAGLAEEPAGSDVPATGGCGCGCSGQTPDCSPQDIAASNALAGHYHALFAQYARLHGAGLLTRSDLEQWQRARVTYEAAVDVSFGPRGGR